MITRYLLTLYAAAFLWILGMKIAHGLALSWVWVLAPVWIPFFGAVVGGFVVACIGVFVVACAGAIEMLEGWWSS